MKEKGIQTTSFLASCKCCLYFSQNHKNEPDDGATEESENHQSQALLSQDYDCFKKSF